MDISISPDAIELGRKAARFISRKLEGVIQMKGMARIVVSTGSSQFSMFSELVRENIDWPQVEVYHLDEYIGLPVTHNASFRKYLYERFISLVPVRQFHSVDVEVNIPQRIKVLSDEISKAPPDIGIIGIGVNGHIAFNDPPADFETRDPYIIVRLDKKCREQQVDEGWFSTIEEVPLEAVSMSVWQIMQCNTIVSVVPHEVKSEAVMKTLTSGVTPEVPASMLKTHSDWHLYLDRNSASKIFTF
jgi:glucosamine-6-phosphate deaminase